MKREIETKNRQLLKTKNLIIYLGMVAGASVCFVGSFVEMPAWLRIAVISFSVVILLAVAFIAEDIEREAGYYECQECHYRYVPSYWQMILGPNRGQARRMTCPKCGKRCWHRKVLTDEE